jgi:hypothetical protein
VGPKIQSGEWTEAQRFSELMTARRAQLPFRLYIAGAFVVGFIVILGDMHIWLWGAVYAALQGAEAVVFRMRDIKSLCNQKRYRAVALSILALNITVFASIPFLELAHFGSWGVCYGEAIVACTFLNVALTTHGSRTAFLASLGPGLIYLILLPIMAWRMFDCPPRVAIAIGTLGVALVFATLKRNAGPAWTFNGAWRRRTRAAPSWTPFWNTSPPSSTSKTPRRVTSFW